MGSGDPAAEQIIRKVLLVNTNVDDWRHILPRLTASDKVNLQLYGLFALACRQFVQSWHSGIINDDSEFLYDLCRVLSRVVTTLYARIQKLSLSDLLFDDIPYLIQSHVGDLRTLKERIDRGLMSQEDLQRVFHALRPLKPLDSAEEEVAFLKILSANLTSLLLAPNDARSPCASVFVSSLLSDIVLKNVTDRLAQPWMIHEILLKSLEAIRRKQKERSASQVHNPQSLPIDAKAPIILQIQQLQKKTIQFFGSLVKKCGNLIAITAPLLTDAYTQNGSTELDSPKETPICLRQIFPMFSALLFLPRRSPLLVGCATALSSPLRYGVMAKVSSRLASSFIRQTIANEEFISNVVKIARESLFSANGYMGLPRVIPTAEQQVEMRKQVAKELVEIVPDRLQHAIYGNDPAEAVEELLSLFDNMFINKHLIYTLLDYLVLSLFEELDREYDPSQSSRDD